MCLDDLVKTIDKDDIMILKKEFQDKWECLKNGISK